MFHVDKNTIEYLETNRGLAFTAQLMCGNSIAGEVENTGRGGATTFDGVSYNFFLRIEELAEEHETSVANLMECYMDLAEGIKPENTELAAKLTNN